MPMGLGPAIRINAAVPINESVRCSGQYNETSWDAQCFRAVTFLTAGHLIAPLSVSPGNPNQVIGEDIEADDDSGQDEIEIREHSGASVETM